MQSIILALNIILSVTLVVLVLIQRTNTDSQGAFSSDANMFKRRGVEKFIYRLTIVTAVLFAVSLAVHALL